MISEPVVVFNAIGGGQVLTKYFLPVFAQKPELILQAVLSRSNRSDFQKFLRKSPYSPRYRAFDLTKITHLKTSGHPEDVLKKISRIGLESNPILILTPPQTHLEMVREFLQSTNRKIYIDKPAVTTFAAFRELIMLMQKFPRRVYLAEQYAYGRCPPLLQNFKHYQSKLGKILRVDLFLEEGQTYFDASQKWPTGVKDGNRKYFDLTGSWFADVGPELDLGVHLLAVLFLLAGADSSYKVISAVSPNNYLENYGVESDLIIKPVYKPPFRVRLKCGKRCGCNNRYFKIVCERGEIWQKYTSRTCQDPVYLKIGKQTKKISAYPPGYLYFSEQIADFTRWLKKPYDQVNVLKALECALKIKDKRVSSLRSQDTNHHYRIIAMIPARMENRLLKKKHIRDMAGKPMVYYALKAALDAKIFERVYVNSESSVIGSIGQKLGASFYKRDPELAEEGVNNEEFVYDFLKNIKTEYLFMINPNKPLISPGEIKNFVKTMIKKKLDVMFSTEEVRTQVFFQGKPVNFDLDKPHLRSYQIEPAQALQWTITGWRAKTFLENYQQEGHAVYRGKLGLFPVSEDANFSVKHERDFVIAEKIMRLAPKK